MLDGAAARTDFIDCLMCSLAPCCWCPLSDVRISPTLVNKLTCLRLIAACNYGAVGPTRILGKPKGLVRFWPEQISAVTDSVPEQWREDRMITTIHYTTFVWLK